MVTIVCLAESSDCYSTGTNIEDMLLMINLMLKAIMITYLYLSFYAKVSSQSTYIKPCILLGVILFLDFVG
jgi:hypothetical protein